MAFQEEKDWPPNHVLHRVQFGYVEPGIWTADMPYAKRMRENDSGPTKSPRMGENDWPGAWENPGYGVVSLNSASYQS